MKKSIILLVTFLGFLVLTTIFSANDDFLALSEVAMALTTSSDTGTGRACLFLDEIKERALDAAKKADIAWSKCIPVFVNSHINNIHDLYQFFFLDGNKLVGIVRIDICGELVGSPESYTNPEEFNDAFLDAQKVQAYFDATGKTNGAKSWKCNLVFGWDIDTQDIPQPIWLLIDENGKDWYITIYGKIYQAESVRREFIKHLKALSEGRDEG